MVKVAVIGAGLAGLTCAQMLKARGFDVDVFEKSRGAGGRLANKRLDWAHLDLGAQYFTARDPRFIRQVEDWQQQHIVSRWEFSPHTRTISGLQLSPDNTRRYVGTPAMNQPAKSLAQPLAKHLNIHFQTRICQLEYNNKQWQLTAEGGKRFANYQRLILSLPAEQSRVLLEGRPIAEQIPPVVHQPCWAVALATRGEDDARVQGIFGDEVVSWVSRLSARPQRPVFTGYDNLWMLHFSSQWSIDNENLPQYLISQTGFNWLQEALGVSLELAHSYEHYWRYARIHPDYQAGSIISDASSGLALIGDWTCGGRIEGAYLSALAYIDSL